MTSDDNTEPSKGLVTSDTPQPKSRATFGWIVGVILSLAFILVGGAVHGHLSNRWGIPADVNGIGEKLREVPASIGPWISAGDQEMGKTALTLLECKGYLNRTYVHRTTGESVSVAVMFGPKGPIAVHTPEICYSSRDVTAIGKRQSEDYAFDGADSRLWKLRFSKNDLTKSKLNVTYGWSDGGPWYAAEAPRFWRTDYLYKIQTASPATNSSEDSTTGFLKVFLPELRKVMRTNES
jgi:hypothetical protein